jgi:hypothetical protein
MLDQPLNAGGNTVVRKTAHVGFRVETNRKQAWQAAAERAGRDLTAWLTELADLAVARDLYARGESETSRRRTANVR